MFALLTLAVLLLLVTGWWLTRPMYLSVAETSAEHSDLELLRDRLIAQLNELDAERLDRGLEAGVADEEERRLSAELADVLRRLDSVTVTAAKPPAATSGSAWRTALVFSGLLLAGGVGVYAWMNATNLQGLWLAANHGAANAQVPPMVFEMVARLEKRLAEQPNDASGWARLGRSYMVLQQADKARTAYAKAYALQPDNVEIVSDYAWVVFNADPTVTTGLVNDLYTRLARLAPNHPDALWFQGFAAFQQGNYRQTLKYWERLETLLPPGDSGREQLQQAIANVRQKLGK